MARGGVGAAATRAPRIKIRLSALPAGLRKFVRRLADARRYAEAAFAFALSGWAGSFPGETSRSGSSGAVWAIEASGGAQASQLIDSLALRCAQTLSRVLDASSKKGAAPVSGAEEQTARAISAYAQYAFLLPLQMWSKS